MNSPYERRLIPEADYRRNVGTHGSCVRARHGMSTCIWAILLLAVAIALPGCSGKKTDRETCHQVPTLSPIVDLCQSIDYSDTTALLNDTIMAMHVKDIVRLMMRSDSASTAQALDIFFRGLNGDAQALRSASHYAYLYLGNPNSPVRDEALYIRFLSSLLSHHDIPEDVAAKAEDKLHRASLNSPGKRASDFRYIDRDGRKGTLHSFQAPQTLLIFYDPECPHCPQILKKIACDRKVNLAIEAGDLNVLAVYTEGKRDMWEQRKTELPGHWTVAYDLTGIVDKEIYDIPAMPTVYLLDADKRVLVKDMAW